MCVKKKENTEREEYIYTCVTADLLFAIVELSVLYVSNAHQDVLADDVWDWFKFQICMRAKLFFDLKFKWKIYKL